MSLLYHTAYTEQQVVFLWGRQSFPLIQYGLILANYIFQDPTSK